MTEETNEPNIDDSLQDTFSYDIKIPEDRIAVLIGPKGSMKNKLEHWANVNSSV